MSDEAKVALEKVMAKLPPPPKKKPFYKTSEFWLTLASNVAAVLASAQELLPAPYAALVLALSNGLYAVSRGLAKS